MGRDKGQKIFTTREGMLILGFYGSNSIFSNMYELERPLNWELEGVPTTSYWSVEVAYQTSKAKACGDMALALRISQSTSPYQAKKLGKRVQIKEIWETIKLEVMGRIQLEKYSANPDLRLSLLNSYPAILAEACTDKVWGTGLPLSDPYNVDPTSWLGTNWSGEAAMACRRVLGKYFSFFHYLMVALVVQFTIIVFITNFPSIHRWPPAPAPSQCLVPSSTTTSTLS